MLYIIGGAPRSGKSKISRRMLVEKQVSYFPMDVVTTVLEGFQKTVGVFEGQDFIEKSQKSWVAVKNLLDHLYETEENYLVEGDNILPSQISNFLNMYNSKDIRICFVGYIELDPREKLRTIRENSGGKDDWTKIVSDEELLPMIQEMIEFSRYLKSECEKYGFKFFDVSHDFIKTQQEVFDYLNNY